MPTSAFLGFDIVMSPYKFLSGNQVVNCFHEFSRKSFLAS